MYSIGQFSIMCNINKKTLRYYDEINLFKPAYIHEMNQYRYYEESQIPIIKEILRLKEIGIPLENIKKVISENKFTIKKKIYSERLQEINILIDQLQKQKKLIETHLSDNNPINEFNKSIIEKGSFLQEGKVYYNNIDLDYEDIDNVIGGFYSKAKGIELTSGHIFKRSLEENSKGFSEIFAYTLENIDSPNVRFQNKITGLKCLCQGISKRESAYKSLFDYSRDNGYSIKDVYERYIMNGGKMNIEIIGSIE
ncbi:MerR family transcriptional regulator [Clostridium intestinale]|uniref:MerR family transcriptional regulator n=1 Tax=Clostridium intestinale TaxID=36845 RepID=UPI0028E5985C|nr:MerR family transcriptional regulator [Clostridium intestinale]